MTSAISKRDELENAQNGSLEFVRLTPRKTKSLFSDIAPLLALFGERFTISFMSESQGWLDHIVFASKNRPSDPFNR